MKIADFASGLEFRDGIYFSKNAAPISYPENGNQVLFDIEDNSFWFRHRNQVIPKVIKRFSSGKVFFDVGGGNGYVSHGIESEGIETVLVEPGPQGCKNGLTRGLKTVVCATLQEAGFKDRSLPAIGLFDVVEHIENDLKFLKMIHGYIENGGHLYLTVPTYKALWSNEDKDAGHFRRYTVSSMKKQLKKAGFDVVFSTYLFSILPLPIFLFRSLPSRLGIHKNSDSPEKYKNEHSMNKGLFDRITDWFLKKEAVRISKGKSIPFGSSCFIVAQKLQS